MFKEFTSLFKISGKILIFSEEQYIYIYIERVTLIIPYIYISKLTEFKESSWGHKGHSWVLKPSLHGTKILVLSNTLTCLKAAPFPESHTISILWIYCFFINTTIFIYHLSAKCGKCWNHCLTLIASNDLYGCHCSVTQFQDFNICIYKMLWYNELFIDNYVITPI